MPEALKNLLLVMASRGILTEQWRVRCCSPQAKGNTAVLVSPHVHLCGRCDSFCSHWASTLSTPRWSWMIRVRPGSPAPGQRTLDSLTSECSCLIGVQRRADSKMACGCMVQDARGHNLWQLTWTHARDISSGLSPQLLATTGVSRALPAPPGAAGTSPADMEPPAQGAAQSLPADAAMTSGSSAAEAAAAASAIAASPLAAALAAAQQQVLWTNQP